VPQHTMRVHAHQDISPPSDFTADKGHVALRPDGGVVHNCLELAVDSTHAAFAEAVDDAFICHTVADKVGYRNHLEPMADAELFELRHAGHRAVVIHDLADDATGGQTGKFGEIDGGLGLPRAHENPAFTGAQGKHVAGTGQIQRAR